MGRINVSIYLSIYDISIFPSIHYGLYMYAHVFLAGADKHLSPYAQVLLAIVHGGLHQPSQRDRIAPFQGIDLYWRSGLVVHVKTVEKDDLLTEGHTHRNFSPSCSKWSNFKLPAFLKLTNTQVLLAIMHGGLRCLKWQNG